MKYLVRADALAKALADQGLLPADARRAEILIGANQALVIRFEVFVDESMLPRIAAAFEAVATATEPASQKEHTHES